MYCNNQEAIHFSVLEYPNNTNVHVAFKIPLKKIVCTLCFMPCLFFIYSHKVILENIQLVLLVWKSFLKETSINYYSIRNITNPKKIFYRSFIGIIEIYFDDHFKFTPTSLCNFIGRFDKHWNKKYEISVAKPFSQRHKQ